MSKGQNKENNRFSGDLPLWAGLLILVLVAVYNALIWLKVKTARFWAAFTHFVSIGVNKK